MDREKPWEPSQPVQVTPEEYEKQVVSWLELSEGNLANFQVQHLEKVTGSSGDFILDAVARFEMFGGAEIAILVECKRLQRPVERDVIMTLDGKIQSTGSHKGIVFSTSGFQRGAIEYAAEKGIATVTFNDGVYTYVTKSAERPPRSGLPADIPVFAGFWLAPTDTGLKISTISNLGVEAVSQWLVS